MNIITDGPLTIVLLWVEHYYKEVLVHVAVVHSTVLQVYIDLVCLVSLKKKTLTFYVCQSLLFAVLNLFKIWRNSEF